MQHDHSRILRESKLRIAKKSERRQLEELRLILGGWTRRTGIEGWRILGRWNCTVERHEMRKTGVF